MRSAAHHHGKFGATGWNNFSSGSTYIFYGDMADVGVERTSEYENVLDAASGPSELVNEEWV